MDTVQQKDKDGNDIFIKVNVPQLQGVKVLGKIELPQKKVLTNSNLEKAIKEITFKGANKENTKHLVKSKEQKETLHQLRCKVGFRFDKVWKNKKKTREEMNAWAIKTLKLKTGSYFNVQDLNEAQLEILSLKLKFELDI